MADSGYTETRTVQGGKVVRGYKGKRAGESFKKDPAELASEEEQEFARTWEGGKASGLGGARLRSSPEFKQELEIWRKKRRKAGGPTAADGAAALAAREEP